MIHSFLCNALLSAISLIAFANFTVNLSKAQSTDVRSDVTERKRQEETERVESTDLVRLINDLGSPVFGNRQSAFVQLVQSSSNAIPLLVEAAKTDDIEVAKRSTEVLERLSVKPETSDVAIHELRMLAGDATILAGICASRAIARLQMSSEEKAINKLMNAGVPIAIDECGKATSVVVDNDRYIGQLQYLPNLRVLALVGPLVTDAGLSRIPDIRHISDVTVENCSLSHRGFQHLCEHGRFESLTISSKALSVSSMHNITGMPSLKSLTVRTSVGAELIRPLVCAQQIEVVRLPNVEMSEDVAVLLGQLNHLSRLDISTENVIDQDLESLGRLSSSVALLLNIGRSPALTSESWRELQHAHVVSLEIPRNKLGDVDLVQIGTIKSLEMLFITTSSISDAGLSHLGGLRSLKCLSIRRSNCTNLESKDNLCKLIPSLRSVEIGIK